MSSMLRGRQVMVTGGAGFIGSHVCERLVQAGATVVVVDDLSTGLQENLRDIDAARLRLVVADCSRGEVMAELLVDADAVIHLAALVSVQRSIESPEESYQRNVATAFTVFSTAAKRHLPLLFASSAAVYGANPVSPASEDAALDPLSPYAADKLYLEFLAKGLRSRGLRSLGLRLFNVYGPRQRADSPYSGVITKFLANIDAGAPCAIFGDGEQTRDFVHVDDVADAFVRGTAHLLAAGHHMEAIVLNCGCGRATSIRQLHALLAAGVPPLWRDAVAGEVRHSCADATRIREQLSWQPRFELPEGLASLRRVVGGG